MYVAPAFFHDTLLNDHDRKRMADLLKDMPRSARVTTPHALAQTLVIVDMPDRGFTMLQESSCELYATGPEGKPHLHSLSDLSADTVQYLTPAFAAFHEQYLGFTEMPAPLRHAFTANGSQYYTALHFTAFWMIIPDHYGSPQPRMFGSADQNTGQDERSQACAIFVPGAKTRHARLKAAADIKAAWPLIENVVEYQSVNRHLPGNKELRPFDPDLFERDLAA